MSNTPTTQPPPPKTPPPPMSSGISGAVSAVAASGGAISAVVAPKTGGGIDTIGPWTGGSREPGRENASSRTPMCYRTAKQAALTYNELRKGVDSDYVIKSNNDHYTSQEKMWKDLMNFGLDSVFYALNPQTNVWVELFHLPDTMSVDEIKQHENELRNLCSRAAENLTWARTYIEQSVSKNIYNEIDILVSPSDGGCVYWKVLMSTMQGEATTKWIEYQNIIKETKLVNIKGYNVREFHKKIMPPLQAAHQNNALPLNVGPIVLKNHLGPNSIAFNALVTSYAAEQAKESNQEKQFSMLLPQMRSLNQTYCNEASTWEEDHKNVSGFVSEALTQDPKNKGRNKGNRKCFNCGSADHLVKYCPKKKKSDSGGSNENNANEAKKKPPKWLFQNKDGKTTMTKDGCTYNWCKSCAYNRGKWVTHKPSECKYKKKESEKKDSEEGEAAEVSIVMELIEGAFLASL